MEWWRVAINSTIQSLITPSCQLQQCHLLKPNPDKPRGIILSNGASRKSQISNNKIPSLSPYVLVGDKSQTATHREQNNNRYQVPLSYFV